MLSWSEASNDPVVIERWGEKYQVCNWGVIIEPEYGIVVIDIDPRNGGLETIQQKGWKFPKTVAVRTGGGGLHYYYCDPYGIPANIQLGPGVELKVNGMLVVPPSRHKSGGSYEFDVEEGLPPHEPFAELPAWVYKALDAKNSKEAYEPTIKVSGPRIPKGFRNSTLASKAGWLRWKGLEREEIEQELLRINKEQCDPPLDEIEVKRIAKSIARYPKGNELTANIELVFRDKDKGHALVLYEFTKDLYRWAKHKGSWMLFRTYWRPVSEAAMVNAAGDLLRNIYEGLQTVVTSQSDHKLLAKKIIETDTYDRMAKALKQLSGFPGIETEAHEWDANKYLLNAPNGTFDFKEGTFRDHDPRDLITKTISVVYDPDATAPRWMQHLELFLPNPNVRRQVQRDLGRALVGAVLEECLSIWYGIGANGKTTTVRVLQKILGDYACQAAPNLLVKSKYERHPTEIADLHGRRLVFCSEIDQGKELAEALVKQLTGGDKLKARFMGKDFFQFEQTFSIILVTNHKPIIQGSDIGIWRRITIVPWEYTIPAAERRPQEEVVEELLEEAPGILNWLIAGLADWQNDRHWIAPEVFAASEEYRAVMDVVGKFIEDRCELGPRYTVPKGILYDAFIAWCQENGEQPISKKAFTAHLRAKGIGEARVGDARTRVYVGIRLRNSA